jgi:hypothetical protein
MDWIGSLQAFALPDLQKRRLWDGVIVMASRAGTR